MNFSMGASILIASCGAKVVKQGNRSSSSSYNSADVLEALGIVIDLDLEDFVAVLASSTVNYEVKIVLYVKVKKKEMHYSNLINTRNDSFPHVVKTIEYESSFNDEEKKQSKFVKVTYNLNNGASKLKLKDYKQPEKLGTEVLELDSTNVKALYMRSQAYIQLVDLDLAEADIKRDLKIDPENRNVILVYPFLKKNKEYNKKDAEFYRNILAKMNKLDQAKACK